MGIRRGGWSKGDGDGEECDWLHGDGSGGDGKGLGKRGDERDGGNAVSARRSRGDGVDVGESGGGCGVSATEVGVPLAGMGRLLREMETGTTVKESDWDVSAAAVWALMEEDGLNGQDG